MNFPKEDSWSCLHVMYLVALLAGFISGLFRKK